MKRFASLLIALILAPTLALASPVGLWSRTGPNGETKIEIEQDGVNYTGTIAWMENPRNDTNNPDPALQDRPLVGVQLFNDMTQINENRWEGSLYNPEDGNTYEGSVTVLGPDTLELEGCVTIIIFPICQSDTWTRTTLSVSHN